MDTETKVVWDGKGLLSLRYRVRFPRYLPWVGKASGSSRRSVKPLFRGMVRLHTYPPD